MKKFILKIRPEIFHLPYNGEPSEQFKQLMTLERHFTSADISDLHFHKNIAKSLLIDVVERFGKWLISFNLEYTNLTLQTMLDLLKQMPELESLTLSYRDPDIYGDRVSEADIFDFDPVTLKKLKKMWVGSDWNVFRLIKTPELVDLKVRASDTNFNSQGFESFLKASPKLESLEVEGIDLFGKMSSEFPFQLKRLICSSCNCDKLGNSAKEFLVSQAATVEEMKADCDDSELYEIVLSNFKQLAVLDFNFNKLTASDEFYKNLEPMPLVTKLDSVKGFPSDIATRAILGNCPNLESLDCMQDENISKHLDFIAEHNRNLKFLEVLTIRATNVRFQSLADLTVGHVEDADQFIAFLKTNPTITMLTIRNLEDNELSNKSLDILINETNLRHVFIDASVNAADQIYKKIQGGHGTWRKLHVRNTHCYSTVCDLVFPDSPDKDSDSDLI